MKKLLLLGGSRYIVPVIKKAKELGLYVITCDYLPDNIAHKYSDEYLNISIVEKEKVLEAACKLKIDGIMSFACDPGVVTAAYVAETMGLPFQCSYNSAKVLQDKGEFRKMLKENGFNSPKANKYYDKGVALKEVESYKWPIMVKPTDSAGSKGVSKVCELDELSKAIDIALSESRDNSFIIEEFLEFEGFHSSADPFTVNGDIRFVTYSDQLFDKQADNPYTPAFIIWPSSMKQKYQDELTRETQRLMNILGMKHGIYNVETCVSGGKPYIMEVSPRGGGCKIAEIQKLAYGVDLIENEIRKAVGLEIMDIPQTECNGYWCEMVIHTNKEQCGVLKEIFIDEYVKEKYLKLMDLSVKPGDYVESFTGANKSLGDLFLRFDSREELNSIIGKVEDWLHIILE